VEKHAKVLQYGPRASNCLREAEYTLELDTMLVFCVLHIKKEMTSEKEKIMSRQTRQLWNRQDGHVGTPYYPRSK